MTKILKNRISTEPMATLINMLNKKEVKTQISQYNNNTSYIFLCDHGHNSEVSTLMSK